MSQTHPLKSINVNVADFSINLQNITWPSKYATPYTLATVLSLSPAFQPARLERPWGKPRHSHLQWCFYEIKCLTPRHSKNLTVSFLPCHTYPILHPLATGKAKEDLQQVLRQKQGPEAPGPEEAALWVSGRLASRVFWVCLTPG